MTSFGLPLCTVKNFPLENKKDALYTPTMFIKKYFTALLTAVWVIGSEISSLAAQTRPEFPPPLGHQPPSKGSYVVKQYLSGPWKGGKAIIRYAQNRSHTVIHIYDKKGALKKVFKIWRSSKYVAPPPTPAAYRAASLKQFAIPTQINNPEKGIELWDNRNVSTGPRYGIFREFERRVIPAEEKKSGLPDYEYTVEEVNRRKGTHVIFYYKTSPAQKPILVATEKMKNLTFLSNYAILSEERDRLILRE